MAAVALFAGLAGAQGAAPDAFEPDDTPAQASWIGVSGAAQRHNHHVEGDQDWAKFYAEADQLITVRTENLGVNADTFLEVFAESDPTEAIAFDDDGGIEPASSSVFLQPPADGFYLVRVTHALDGFGVGTEYDLAVLEEIGGVLPGTLTGVVAAAGTGLAQPIGGAVVTLTGFGGLTATADAATGVYTFAALPADRSPYTVRAEAAGYLPATRQADVVSGTISTVNIELESAAPPDPADINNDGTVDAVDVQFVINGALGIPTEFPTDTDGDGDTDAADIQRVINRVLGV